MKECSLKYILAGVVIGYFLFRPQEARQTVDNAVYEARKAVQNFTTSPTTRYTPGAGINYLPRYGTKSKTL